MNEPDIREAFADLERKQGRARRWFSSKQAKPIAGVMSELMARRGYARVQTGQALQDAWREAAGERFARQTRAGKIRRGVLDVFVANSTLMQELVYAQSEILEKIRQHPAGEAIKSLRFKTGRIE